MRNPPSPLNSAHTRRPSPVSPQDGAAQLSACRRRGDARGAGDCWGLLRVLADCGASTSPRRQQARRVVWYSSRRHATTGCLRANKDARARGVDLPSGEPRATACHGHACDQIGATFSTDRCADSRVTCSCLSRAFHSAASRSHSLSLSLSLSLSPTARLEFRRSLTGSSLSSYSSLFPALRLCSSQPLARSLPSLPKSCPDGDRRKGPLRLLR